MRLPLTAVFLLLYILFSAFTTSADQIKNNDQEAVLIKKTAKESTDTGKLTYMIRLGLLYVQRNPNKIDDLNRAISIGNISLRLAQKIKNASRQGDSYDLISRAYQSMGDLEKAKTFEKAALRSYVSAHEYNQIGYASKQLAGYFSFQNERELGERIKYTEGALQAYLYSGNKLKQGETYQELGNLYSLNGDEFKAIQNLKDGINVYRSIKYQQLQGLYFMLNECYDQLHDFKQAINYGQTAVKTAETVKDNSSQLSAIYNHLGKSYKDIGQLDNAVKCFQSALRIAETNKDKDTFDIVLLNLAGTLITMKRGIEAIGLLKTFKQSGGNEANAILNSVYLNAYVQLQLFGQAEKYFRRTKSALQLLDSAAFAREITIPRMIAFLFATKKYDQASHFVDDLDKYARHFDSKKILVSNQHWLFRLDSAKGKYIAAIKHTQQERSLQALMNNINSQNVLKLEIQYEAEKEAGEIRTKTQNIQLLTKQSQLQQAQIQKAELLRNVIISGIVMMAILLALGYNRYQIKQKHNIQLELQQGLINDKNRSLEGLIIDKDGLLKEKEWLIKEIHHRVKNNLQIVISLLNTQSVYLDNNDALQAIQESQHRMHSISLIHQKLYQSENLAYIHMDEYIADLVEYLKDSFKISENIAIEMEIEPISLDVVQAVPIGLIINEAITNAVKYAFPGNREGRITIFLDEPASGILALAISDNGCGLPANFDINNCTSLGMSLIKGLSKQLHGEFKIFPPPGLTLQITIPNFLMANKEGDYHKKSEDYFSFTS